MIPLPGGLSEHGSTGGGGMEETMRFKGKVAVVTGGARGIGRAVAEGLAREGACVVIADLAQAGPQEAEAQIRRESGARVSGVVTDVKDIDQIRRMISFAENEYGRLDLLFNGAGICRRTPVEEIGVEEWDHMLQINLRGVFLCCQAAMPLLKRHGSGSILNMASLAGKVGGIAVGAHYSASKAGVICLTKSFAKVLAPHGVTVNALAPGPVETGMIEDWPEDVRARMIEETPLGRFATAAEVAQAALFLLSDAARHITGEILDINGGLLMD